MAKTYLSSHYFWTSSHVTGSSSQARGSFIIQNTVEAEFAVAAGTCSSRASGERYGRVESGTHIMVGLC